MCANALEGKTIAILVADNFQVLETFYPYFRLKEEGAAVFFVGAQAGAVYRDAGGEPATASLSAQDALALEFDLIHCPGGFAPLAMRAHPATLELAKKHFGKGRLFSTICHGASFAVAMGILKGRRATCYRTLRDDVVNAGACYVDEAPVVDRNLITARTPADLPMFMEAVVAVMRGEPPTGPGLTGKRAAILVEARYQIHEAWYTRLRLKSEDVDAVFVGPDDEDTLLSRYSKYPLVPDVRVSSVASDLYDVVIVTGDWAADKMRVEPPFLDFLKQHNRDGRVVASIAEGHSVLVSANLLAGRSVASLPEMQPEVENAGARWVSSVTHVDGNLVTAGGTSHVPQFLAELLRKMEKG